MTEAIIVALLSCLGTLLGSLAGIVSSSKMINYRVDKIEERLNMMDQLDKRLTNLEAHNQVQDEQIANLQKETKRNETSIKELG